MAQRRLVDEIVIAVVADLIERDIEARRIEGLVRGPEKTSRSTSGRRRSIRASE